MNNDTLNKYDWNDSKVLLFTVGIFIIGFSIGMTLVWHTFIRSISLFDTTSISRGDVIEKARVTIYEE